MRSEGSSDIGQSSVYDYWTVYVYKEQKKINIKLSSVCKCSVEVQ